MANRHRGTRNDDGSETIGGFSYNAQPDEAAPVLSEERHTTQIQIVTSFVIAST